MIKLIFSTCLCILIFNTAFCQDADKYRSIYLGIGPRTLDTNPGTISTTFTDNSSSLDFFPR